MADQAVVHIGENSPEHVAYQLVQDLAKMEGKVLHRQPGAGSETATRKWLLDTYMERFQAVRGYRSKPKQWPSESQT